MLESLFVTDSTHADGPIPFVRWLHAQAKADSDRVMPYASIYRWGPNIHAILGPDGRFDAEWVALQLSQEGADADALSALVSAEAAWRVDSLVESAEMTGVSLNVPGSDEPVISDEASKELDKSSTKVLCGYRNHRGEGCSNQAVEGAGRCGAHGGAITDPEVRRSFLLVAFAKVIDGSRIAVEALLDVAENGRSEMARVQAAKELLDRAGVQQDQHVHIHKPEEDTSEDELLEAIRGRLSETKNRLRLHAIEASSEPVESAVYTPRPQPHLELVNGDDDIVDAEIIETETVKIHIEVESNE
jgi:hypothetical protein